MIIAVVGAGGGVGTSTVALLLASALEESRTTEGEVVLLEADRVGGVLGARFELGISDGLQAWVAGLATESTAPAARFGKLISTGLRVIPAPPTRTDAARVLSDGVLEMVSVAMTANSAGEWIVDLGCHGSNRLQSVAGCSVIVSSGQPEHIVRLPDLVDAARPSPSIVVISGRSSWPVEEVRQHCGATEVIESPEIRLSVAQVIDLIEGRKRRRSPVWRAILRCRDSVVDSVKASTSEASDKRFDTHIDRQGSTAPPGQRSVR